MSDHLHENTQLGYLKVLQSPMIDAPALLLALLFLLYIKKERFILVSVVSIIMILTKDSLIILGIVPFILLLTQKNIKWLLPIILMSIVFVGLRLMSDVDLLSLQYGWDVSMGDVRLTNKVRLCERSEPQSNRLLDKPGPLACFTVENTF
jgi:hypothetical protein